MFDFHYCKYLILTLIFLKVPQPDLPLHGRVGRVHIKIDSERRVKSPPVDGFIHAPFFQPPRRRTFKRSHIEANHRFDKIQVWQSIETGLREKMTFAIKENSNHQRLHVVCRNEHGKEEV